MLRSRFLWKLYAGYAVLILLAAGIVGWLVARGVERETLEEIDRQLELEARLLGEIALGTDELSIRSRLLDLGTKTETRFTVIRADGVVLADSDEDAADMDNHGRRPEVLQAQAEGRGTSTRFSRTLDKRMRYLALPVELDGRFFGVVRTSLPLTVLEHRLAQLRRAVFLGAAVAAGLALALAFFLARRFTEPLVSMTRAAESIADGAYRQKVPVPTRDELGKLACAFNTMSDKLREAAAQASGNRHKLEAILGSMVEGVIAVDRDERIVHLNQGAARLLEVEAGAVLARPIWEVTRIREISEVLAETLRREEVVHRLVRLPGTPDRFFDFHASPLRTGGGHPAGAVLVLDDVTQLRRLETIRRDFVGNVSHELKTPVAAIRGLVETLLDDPEAKPAIRRRFLGKVLKQAERLSNLVTDLLSLSRLEAEDSPLELDPLDIRGAILSSVRALQPSREAKNVDLEPRLGDEPLLVRAEQETLEQAVTNLLDNAIKYSPEGGRVTVRAGAEGGRAVIAVEDRGPGIEPLHQDRVFERFYRVDAARSRALGGTGLGLAIVKHVALSLGGEVSLDSVPGEGSTFRIHLPLAAWRPAHPPRVDRDGVAPRNGGDGRPR